VRKQGPNPADAERRRGLNVPIRTQSLTPDERDLLALVVAPGGALRTLALLRAILVKRRDPDLYRRIVLTDTMNQVVGKSALYNRDVLEISDFDNVYAEGFTDRGARVVRMRREPLKPKRGHGPAPIVSSASFASPVSYSSLHIPAPDKAFDLVFGTNVLSSVQDSDALIDELVRVTRPGGSLYLQNATWLSPWGGRETYPLDLFSDNLARRRHVRRHGHSPRTVHRNNYFRIRVRQVMKKLREDPRLVVVNAHPRYLPESFGWLLRVPVLNELVTMSLVVTLERTSD